MQSVHTTSKALSYLMLESMCSHILNFMLKLVTLQNTYDYNFLSFMCPMISWGEEQRENVSADLHIFRPAQ